MIRQVKYTVSDIAFDAAGIGKRLTALCIHGGRPYMVRGLCQLDEAVTFVLVPCEHERPADEYHLIKVPTTEPEAFEAELSIRWHAGFDCIGLINLGPAEFLMLLARVDATAEERAL